MLEPSVAASDISPDEALRSERLIPFMVASLEASLLPNEDSQRSACLIQTRQVFQQYAKGQYACTLNWFSCVVNNPPPYL